MTKSETGLPVGLGRRTEYWNWLETMFRSTCASSWLLRASDVSVRCELVVAATWTAVRLLRTCAGMATCMHMVLDPACTPYADELCELRRIESAMSSLQYVGRPSHARCVWGVNPQVDQELSKEHGQQLGPNMPQVSIDD